MKTALLADLAEKVDYGVTASASAEPVGPKFLRITDIQDGAVDWSAVPFCTADARKLKDSRLTAGDIVFARTGATTGKSFLIRACPRDAVFASYLIRVRPSARIDPGFLAHFFNSAGYWQQIAQKSVGAAQPGVNASKLEELVVPTPSIEEQRRIAAILDEADALRAKRRAALAQLDEIPRAIFLEMFGDPVTNDRKWPKRPLKALGKVSTGNTPPSDRPGMFGGDIPFVTPGDLGSGEAVRRTLTPEGASIARQVRAGAALVCCIGATIGKMDKAKAPSAFNQQINAISWGDDVNDDYGIATLGFFKRHIAEWGASTTLPILKKSAFEDIQIPIASRHLQDEFGLRASTTMEARNSARFQLLEFDSLFASLQHRAFRGEL